MSVDGNTVSNQLIGKIMLSFVAILLLVGISYVGITYYFSAKFYEETTQKLNAHVAQHLIEERFQNADPFLSDGTVNKALFGNIMHDMMAVNRGIEVYLLDSLGNIEYSVVLDHSKPEKPAGRIDLQPIQNFISCNGDRYILGDDPRNTDNKKIFSAAPFTSAGRSGFIYIILDSKIHEEINTSLVGSYFMKIGFGASIATLIFASALGLLSIWFLTKNLREILTVVRRFKEGDLHSRVHNPKGNDLSILAETYNSMADTITANIEELKSVESLRKELIANVSHDLRTPLAIILGYIETMQIKQDKLSKEELEKYLGIVRNSTEKLTNLVEQLFEYSKLEAKQIEPVKETFHISDLAHDVYEKYQRMAADKSISIKLEVEENLPMVFADVSLVERVIQNLMDNALKFTPDHGSVTLSFQSNDKQVMVSIQDTGPGIPESELSHIFERHKKTERSSKGLNTGAGLGLAIVKKIIELHESTVQVFSGPNEGTKFQFALPLVGYQN